MHKDIRNICIIAHVDHGKTTLVDHLLKQAGTHQAHENIAERVMDSEDQEKERGITISAKNAAFTLGDTKVNIMDTPGHADFGGEVERILGMADGAILLVDAAEGPLPQTRFVLSKAIEKNLNIILCINKVDRQEVQGNDLVTQCVDKTFDLFVELGATDEQCDFPIVYACARDGICCSTDDGIPKMLAGEDHKDLKPLYDLIKNLPSPIDKSDAELSMMVSNISYSDFIGFMALGRIRSGVISVGDTVYRHGVDEKGNPMKKKFQVSKLLEFKGLIQEEVKSIGAGNIGLVAGCDDYQIGDTIGGEETVPLERIVVEKPTMSMIFSVNTTPKSGADGKAIQSRELRERLIKEVRNNVALQLENAPEADQFYLMGRGELQFSIIIEKLRREGLEFMVGRPFVLMKEDESGEKQEPFERLTIDVPDASSSDVTNMFQQRKGVLMGFEQIQGNSEVQRVKMTIEIPTRGILGMNSRFKTLTRGAGILSSEIIGYREHQGEIAHRKVGSIIADRAGKTTAYALVQIQQRGQLFLGEGIDVYEGMIIGECAKENDINVFANRPKKLSNVRSSGSDGLTILHGTKKMSLEQCIEWIDEDEWIEITPVNVRLRKKVLPANMRSVKRADRVN